MLGVSPGRVGQIGRTSVQGAEPALWTPLLLAGNNRLINPTDASSLTMVSTKVGQINDLGGQQNILQDTDANRPTVANGLLVFTAAASMWMTQKGGRSHGNTHSVTTVYQMPDVAPSDPGKGFTNTGLALASHGRYWVGNHGRKLLGDVTWDASAVLLNADLLTAHAVISLTSLGLTQGTVQGVAEAPDGTLWMGIGATAGRGVAHVQVNYDGSNNYVSHSLIDFFATGTDANGLAYDTDLDAVIWCAQSDNPVATWIHPTTGATIQTRTLVGTAIDQISYRSPNYIFASRDSSTVVNVIDVSMATPVLIEAYTLTGNSAPEGIIFSDSDALICNDDYIHNASPFLNVIKRWTGLNAKTRKRNGTKFVMHGVVQLPGGPPGTRAVWSAGQPLSTTLPGFGLFIPSGSTTVLRVFANNRSCNFTVPALTTALAYLAKVDLVAGSVEMFINGTSIGTQTLTGTASNASIDRYAPLMLDGYENVTTLTTGMSVNIGITGDIAGELTADEADRVMAWDAWQYATAIPALLSSLASGNPYKAAPPTV